MITDQLKEFQEVEKDVVSCYEFFNKNKEKMNLNIFEEKLNNIKKTMIRNTAINIINIIDKVVENGSINSSKQFRQFSVNSVQIGFEETILLVTREIIGIDSIDKKYILDPDVTYIDFNDIKCIY